MGRALRLAAACSGLRLARVGPQGGDRVAIDRCTGSSPPEPLGGSGGPGSVSGDGYAIATLGL
eukprot:15052413-Alexandrium_andersonii.AAC.1